MKKLLEEVLKRRQEEVLEAELEARAEAILIERGQAMMALQDEVVARSNTTAEKLLFRLHYTALMMGAGRMRAANKSFSKAQDFCRELIDQGH